MRYLIIAILLTPTLFLMGQSTYDLLKGELQETLEQIVTENQLSGMTFSLSLDDDHQINLAAGYANLENKTKMQPDHRMLSGSVGKLFFGVLALELIQNDQLRLDDKVSTYLGHKSWFKDFPNNESIKIIHLLNHTSGVPRHLFQPEFLKDFRNDPIKKRTPEFCIQYLTNKPALFKAGEGWAYSDANFILLGLIIEEITKTDIYELVNKEFIVPLNLELTEPSTKRTINQLCQGYIGPQNPFQLPEKVLTQDGKLVLDPSFEWTGGGFATNPADLTKFLRFIQESNYLDPETKKQMRTAVNNRTGKEYDQGYGLGCFVWSKKEDIRYGHSGFFPGYLSYVEYSKNRQYAIAIQINTDQGSGNLQQYIFQLEAVIERFLDQLDEDKIRQNFKEQEACWNKGDIECYMKAYARSEPIQTASRAGITYGYDNIIGDYKKYFPKDKMGTLFFDEIRCRRLSDHLYFVTGRFNLKFDGREEPAQGWFSVTMKKINGEWRMITDHSS